MANLTPLRNIHVSGGLFTENLLLKIRDKKDQISEVQWNTFGEKWQEEKKQYYEVWDWAKRLFGEIADKLESWPIKDRYEKWIKPLLQKIGHESKTKEEIDLSDLSEEEQDNILNKIQISHQFKNHAKIGLHICEDDNFDERNEKNYQKKSQHDHFQRYILLNEGVRWGLLSNGKYIRLLGEYSNIYAKGYVQFNLDSIFINRDESEFWVFYALIHYSRFIETFGLNPDGWIEKLEKKWEKTSEKLSKDGAKIEINLISKDILGVCKKVLIDFIEKADKNGVMAINSSDSETFMKNINEHSLDLGEIGRDFYLKELNSIISDINENLSIIQRLQKKSQEEGIEAGKKLRENVKKALKLMGEGLINSSKSFTEDILKGKIEIRDFYQELLRITYRIIFILYAEAKDLLPGVATIYYNDLGLTYLRKKAQRAIRDDQNTDLWYRLLLLFKYLNIGESSLGINAFSGELFNPEKIPLVLNENYNLSLNNSYILKIIRELTIVDLGIGLQSIDYTQIGEEEIGSIYEALLDFQPRYIKKESHIYNFVLEEIDTERKGTGTYYTPKGLIDILLKTTLKPVIEDKLKGLNTKGEKLDAILDLKICDPACGGGSFLLASLDYLGKIYAQIQSEQEFPDDQVLRESRRVILQHCIYGVDLNPMALELAKVSLWLKATVGKKPLTLLNNHLKEGNSLLGLAKKQKIGKIPFDAFNIVKGNPKTGIPDENKKFVDEAIKHFKKLSISEANSGLASVQKTLIPYKDSENYSKIATELFSMTEDNLKDLKEKIKCYSELHKSNSWKNLNIQANLWTSSFFWNFGENYIKEIPTDTLIFRIKRGNLKNSEKIILEVEKLSKVYQFFNWYLEFPEVFQKENPGFDCILMNPPWDVLALKEMEFFSGKSHEVTNTQNQAKRQLQIKKLKETNPELHSEYIKEYYKIKKQLNFFKKSGFYSLSASGTLNLYPLFIERAKSLINSQGKIGCIALSTILTGKTLNNLFSDLIESNSIDSIFSFVNERKIFPDVAHNLEFCLLTINNQRTRDDLILMAFFIWEIDKFLITLENYENKINEDEFVRSIREGGTILELKKEDFHHFNPNSRSAPVFKRKKYFSLIKKAYGRAPILIGRDKDGKEIKNHWGIIIKRFFHPSDDSKLFKTEKELIKSNGKRVFDKKLMKSVYFIDSLEKKEIYYPLYTGAAIWIYDYRFNELVPKLMKSKKLKADIIRVPNVKKKDPYFSHKPMYWVKKIDAEKKFPPEWKKEWYIGYRKVSNSTNQRTFVISVIPKVPSIDSIQNIYFNSFSLQIICLIANLSSLPFDFIVRNKTSGVAITQFMVEQLPVFPPKVYNKLLFNEIYIRAIELIYCTYEMKNFSIDFKCSIEKEPFKYDLERRELLKAELDAIFGLMYGFTYTDFEYIIDNFYVLRDIELREYGEFKTKRLVLKAYNKFNSDPELGPLFRLEGVDLDKLKGV
ncbi:MAG: Eco57I restriction-modification methylase domain-containing protein [Promethearchaeota archaeon]